MVDIDVYTESIFLFHEGRCMVKYDYTDGIVRIEYENIWQIFEQVYGMNYSEACNFFKRMFEKHFKVPDIYPCVLRVIDKASIEDHFTHKKIREILPNWPKKGTEEYKTFYQ